MPVRLIDGAVQGPPPPPVERGWGGGSDGRGSSRRASFTALVLLLVSSSMIFAAFTTAFLVRRTSSGDWAPTPKPPILYVNTAVLAASSACLEAGRRALKRGRRASFNPPWTAGTALGLVFLGGQVLAWKQLSDRGVHLDGNPSSGFFYLLSAAHAAHLCAGVGILLYVTGIALTHRLGPNRYTTVDIAAFFWHFLDGLWLYLMLLLCLWG